MHIDTVIQQVRSLLESKSEIIFAYIFGSAIDTEEPHDIDVAVKRREWFKEAAKLKK